MRTTTQTSALNRKTRIHSGAGLRPASYSARFKNQGAPLNFEDDGWNPLAELDASHSALRTYLWGLNLSGSMRGLPHERRERRHAKPKTIASPTGPRNPSATKRCFSRGEGGLLMVIDHTGSAKRHYAAYDGNGNVMMLVKGSDGTVSAIYEYGPFGETVRATGPMAKANPMRFSTKYQDDATDFLYYGYRSYNPNTGRWLNRDPIGEKGGGPSLYGFCMNSAVNRQDLMGLLTFLVQDCQGCNAGGFLESWGYWYDGFETDPGCQSKWETSEDLAFGWFSHRCGSWPFYPNICNTETYIRIKALNTTCCRKWKIACTYAYSGIVKAQDDANLNVEFYFLGERV